MSDIALILKSISELREETASASRLTNEKIAAMSKAVVSLDSQLVDVRKRAQSAHDLAAEAKQAASETSLEFGTTVDALARHTAQISKTATTIQANSTAIVATNQTQNAELAWQSTVLAKLAKQHPVWAAVGTMIGTTVAAGVSAYLASGHH